jgi:hypothetical protein
MELITLLGVIAAAALVMSSGVWVGFVLIRAVARIERPQPRTETPVTEKRAE